MRQLLHNDDVREDYWSVTGVTSVSWSFHRQVLRAKTLTNRSNCSLARLSTHNTMSNPMVFHEKNSKFAYNIQDTPLVTRMSQFGPIHILILCCSWHVIVRNSLSTLEGQTHTIYSTNAYIHQLGLLPYPVIYTYTCLIGQMGRILPYFNSYGDTAGLFYVLSLKSFA